MGRVSTAVEVVMAAPQAISLALGSLLVVVLSYRQIFVIMAWSPLLAAAYIAVDAARPDRRRRPPSARRRGGAGRRDRRRRVAPSRDRRSLDGTAESSRERVRRCRRRCLGSTDTLLDGSTHA